VIIEKLWYKKKLPSDLELFFGFLFLLN